MVIDVSELHTHFCIMNSTAKKLLRVICFDDNKNILDSVKMLLSTTANMQVIAAFESYQNILENIEAAKPDVAILDIDMPLINGVDAVKLLRTKFPELPVLMLTGFEDDEKVFFKFMCRCQRIHFKKHKNGIAH